MDEDERSVMGVTMLGHAMVHTYELSIPIFIPIWIDSFSSTPATIGVVVAVGYALLGFGSLPSGIVSDAYGSRRLILVCLLGMGLSFLLVSVSPNLVLLGVALLLWGIAGSMYHPAGLSLISTSVDRRGTALGYHGIAGNVGIALGPLVTLLLLLAFDWRVVAALLALPALATGVALVHYGVPTGRPAGAPDGGRPSDADDAADAASTDRSGQISLGAVAADTRTLFAGGFVVIFAIIVFQGIYYRGVLTFLPDMLAGFSVFDEVRLFGRSQDPSQYVYAGLLLIGVVGQYIGGQLTDRVPTERGVLGVLGCLLVVALLYVPAVNAGVASLLLVSATLGIFLFAIQPLLQAIVAEYSLSRNRGLSYGFMYSANFGIGSVGAAMTGAILTYSTANVLFLALAAVELVNILLVTTVVRRRSGERSGASAG